MGLVGFAPEQTYTQLVRSLLVAEFVDKEGVCIDVGSGAGLPGLAIAILRGSTVLIEPRRRAAGFLERAIRELELDATVEIVSAESAARGKWREVGSTVTARALAPFPVALELCAPLCKVGGRVVITGGPDAVLPQLSKDSLDQLGLGPPDGRALDTPGAVHQVIHIVQKLGSCNSKYPRRPGAARRRPLR